MALNLISDEELYGNKPATRQASHGGLSLLSDEELYGGVKGTVPDRTWGEVASDSAIKLGQGVVSGLDSATGLVNLATFGGLRKAQVAMGLDPNAAEEINKDLGSHLSAKQQAEEKAVGEAHGVVGTAKALIDHPSVIVGDILASLPPLLLPAGAARSAVNVIVGGAVKKALAEGATAAAAKAAGESAVQETANMAKVAWANWGATGAQAAGTVAQTIAKENPDDTAKMYWGVPAGVFTAVVGRVAGKIMGDPTTALFSGLGGIGPKGSLPVRVAKGAIEEGALFEPARGYSDKVAENLGSDRPDHPVEWNEGAAESATRSAMVGFAMGGGAALAHGPVHGSQQLETKAPASAPGIAAAVDASTQSPGASQTPSSPSTTPSQDETAHAFTSVGGDEGVINQQNAYKAYAALSLQQIEQHEGEPALMQAISHMANGDEAVAKQLLESRDDPALLAEAKQYKAGRGLDDFNRINDAIRTDAGLTSDSATQAAPATAAPAATTQQQQVAPQADVSHLQAQVAAVKTGLTTGAVIDMQSAPQLDLTGLQHGVAVGPDGAQALVVAKDAQTVQAMVAHAAQVGVAQVSQEVSAPVEGKAVVQHTDHQTGEVLHEAVVDPADAHMAQSAGDNVATHIRPVADVLAERTAQPAAETQAERIARLEAQYGHAAAVAASAQMADQDARAAAPVVEQQTEPAQVFFKTKTNEVAEAPAKFSPTEQTGATKTLVDNLNRDFKLAGDQAIRQDSIVEVKPEKPLQRMAAAIGTAFGVKVVFVHTPTGALMRGNGKEFNRFAGVADRSTKTIYLNVAGTKLHLNILGHELAHILEKANPAIYAKLELTVLSRMRRAAFLKLKAQLEESGKAEGQTAAQLQSQLRSEVVAEGIGQMADDPQLWKDVFGHIGEDGTQAKTFYQAVMDIIAKFQRALTSAGFMTGVKDVATVKRAVVEAYKEWAKDYEHTGENLANLTPEGQEMLSQFQGLRATDASAEKAKERKAAKEAEKAAEPAPAITSESAAPVKAEPVVKPAPATVPHGRQQALEAPRDQQEADMEGEGGIAFARIPGGTDQPGVGLTKGNVLGFWPALRVKVKGKLSLPAKTLIMTGTTNQNAAKQIANIDGILAKFPNATDSAEEWSKMMAYALGSNEVPIPPYNFIADLNGDGSLKKLKTLTQGQIDDATHGFENAAEFRRAYTSGELGVETTGKLFMWSFLSRGVSPYTQESLFIDAFNGADAWVAMAARGEFTEAQFPAYEEWAKSVAPKGSGQPGAGATHNLNAFGQDFLFKMSRKGDDGVTHMQRLHNMMTDPAQTGKQIRREFATFGEGVGIDNKVVSFTLLVAGFPDVMVLDRVQIRQLWDDGRFNGVNLYDGSKDAEGKKAAGSSLNSLAEGARGILVYEAIERGLESKIKDLYKSLGREQDASIGRYHWETWVADSQQEASHGTLGAILADAKGDDTAISNVAAKQGEYGAYEYGTLYNRDSDGTPWFRYQTPTGQTYDFTVPAFRGFLGEIKKPANGVVPTKFKVTESGNGPWFNRPEVSQQRLAEQASKWADRPSEGQRAPAQADADKVAAGSQRADSGSLVTAFSRTAVRDAIGGLRDRASDAEVPGPYTRGSGSALGSVRGLGAAPVASFKPSPALQQALLKAGVVAQTLYEVKAPQLFYDKIAASKKALGSIGSAVELKSVEDYADIRTFLTQDGAAGFGLKGDDIVSVFSNGTHKNATSYMMQLAIQEGGRRLDAFETVLPEIYSAHGMKVVARLDFNPEYKPDGWDYKDFAKFNDGKPDVVFMAYDKAYRELPTRTDGVRVDSYEAGAAEQDKALGIQPKADEQTTPAAPDTAFARSPLKMESIDDVLDFTHTADPKYSLGDAIERGDTAAALVAAKNPTEVKGLLRKMGDSIIRATTNSRIDINRWVSKLPISNNLRQSLQGDLDRSDTVRSTLEQEVKDKYTNKMMRAITVAAKASKLSTDQTKKLAAYWMTARYAPQASAQLITKDRTALLEAQATGDASKIAAAQKDLNDRISSVNGAVRDPKTRGVGGGMNNAEAAEVIRNVEAKIDIAHLNAIADPVYKMMDWKKAKDLEVGKVTQTAVNSWLNSPDYVPLTGDPRATRESNDVFSSGGAINQDKDHEMNGRKDSVADDAIDAAFESTIKSINFAAMQDFKRTLNKTYLATQGQDIGLTREPVTGIMRTGDNVIIYRDVTTAANGQESSITHAFKFKDERLMEALRKDNKEQVAGLLKLVASPTRWYARAVTQFMPMFAPINLVRDIWERSELLRTKKLYAADGSLIDVKKAARASIADVINRDVWKASMMKAFKKGGMNPVRGDLEQFIREGGSSTTGDQLERKAGTLEAEIRRDGSRIGHLSNKVLHVVEGYNDTFEMIPSLAIFRALKAQGMTPKDAAAATLDLMNFRKSGTKMANVKALYIFAQPAATSGHNLAMYLSTRTGQIRFTTQVLLATALYAMLKAAWGDDDDEELGNNLDNLSNFTVERSLPVKLGSYVLKLPVGFGPPQLAWITGATLNRVADGRYSVADGLGELSKGWAKSFAPVAPSDIELTKRPADFFAQTFTPTVLKPLVNIALDQTGLGAGLTPHFKDPNKLKSDQANRTTPGVYTDVAKQLHDMTGIDMYPDHIKALSDGVLLGPVNQIIKMMADNPAKQSRGEPISLPLIGPIIDKINDRGVLNSIYYRVRSDMDQGHREFSALVADRDPDGKITSEMRAQERQYQRFIDTEKMIGIQRSALRKMPNLDEETHDERLQAIETRADAAHRKMLVSYFQALQ